MLTLKDLSQYLPYGIEFIRESETYILCGLSSPYKTNKTSTATISLRESNGGFRTISTFTLDDFDFAKPVLYPLSMLTDINSPLFREMNADLSTQIDIIEFACGNKGLSILPYIAYEELIRNHVWVGDQSYFEKGLIIDKSL